MKILQHTYFFILIAILALASMGELFWLKVTLAQKNEVKTKLESEIKTIELLTKTSKFSLSRNNLTQFKLQKNEIKKQYDDLLLLLDTATPPRRDLTSLEFKEEFLKTQLLLFDRSHLWNIALPKAIGFDELEGGDIPPATAIPQLILQLDTLKTLINLMIESQILELSHIDKTGIRTLQITNSQNMYQVLSFNIALKSTMVSFQNLLSKIYSSSHLFVVRKLDIESQSSGILSISIQVDTVIFERESK